MASTLQYLVTVVEPSDAGTIPPCKEKRQISPRFSKWARIFQKIFLSGWFTAIPVAVSMELNEIPRWV